jgi:hypothetical protein
MARRRASKLAHKVETGLFRVDPSRSMFGLQNVVLHPDHLAAVSPSAWEVKPFIGIKC